ncbi:hypothetical protein E2C01_073232 [Portunus trituberculatus]|uniref:Uncharacterized protein n=1 Tax=Portunus trituberculatus TaxID=210409 RepID=A0A5B7I9B2_PORTR|nr:hypothetical protein [Portunus trituberculatus]
MHAPLGTPGPSVSRTPLRQAQQNKKHDREEEEEEEEEEDPRYALSHPNTSLHSCSVLVLAASAASDAFKPVAGGRKISKSRATQHGAGTSPLTIATDHFATNHLLLLLLLLLLPVQYRRSSYKVKLVSTLRYVSALRLNNTMILQTTSNMTFECSKKP